MSAAIDSSRLYRWPSELVELVEAVTRTDPNNESTWIEWKSTLDLNDKSGHQHIAKQVLGFANRTVATARHHTGGYAYLVVGAEPGNVAGIVPVDPADLQPRIVRYVGPAVRWRAEYVPVQGHQVLVVVVDPPGNGDPVHPVRQQLGDHPRGRVLVRRPGKTEPANDFEVDQLVQRVRAGQGELEFAVEPVFSVIECNPGLPGSEELTEADPRSVGVMQQIPGGGCWSQLQHHTGPEFAERPRLQHDQDGSSPAARRPTMEAPGGVNLGLGHGGIITDTGGRASTGARAWAR